MSCGNMIDFRGDALVLRILEVHTLAPYPRT
jgi:hypothetical protein